jgi:PAS domain S-box-containing protein
LQLRQTYGIPSVFLTAYTDDQTLENARRAAPYGYLVKPFEERELYAAIETALARHSIEQELEEGQSLLTSVLDAIGEGVVAADASGAVQFLNPAAERMTGCVREQAMGRDIAQILSLLDPDTQAEAEFPIVDLIGSTTGLTIRRILVSNSGCRMDIQIVASPILVGADIVRGLVIVLRPIHQPPAIE